MKKALFFPAALLALLTAQFLFVWAYLAKEQTVSFWDYAMYANMAMAWVQLESGKLAAFHASFAQDYNLLFAAPSLLSFSLFGASRTVFILTNFVCFFIPYELALGLLFKRVFDMRLGAALFLGALTVCALPFAWYPLLEGYPDNSAAACLTLAAALALGKSRSFFKGLSFGLLLALAIVFRRHYAYPVLALLLTTGCFDLLACIRAPLNDRVSRFWVLFRFFLWAGLALIGGLVAAEPAYFQSMLETNYLSLYKSYEQTPSFFIGFLFSRLGAILCGLVAIGFVVSWQEAPQRRRFLSFFFVLGLVWLIIWCLGPVQAGDHYLLAILPLVCALGLAGFFVAKRLATPLLIGVGFLLALNSQAALWNTALGPFPGREKGFGLISAPRPPWIRKDLDQLKALAVYIAQTTTDEDRIAVVGSSFTFNQDLMRALYTDVLCDVRPALRFLSAPEIDGKQEPPLNVYASANVYLVATPTQYHLRPEGQKVVTALARLFPPPPESSGLFRKDPQSFHLDDGGLSATVSVWRRVPWTPQALHAGLSAMRDSFPNSGPWILMDPGAGASLDSAQPDLDAQLTLSPQRSKSFVFLDRPLTSGAYRLGGTVLQNADCPDFSLTVSVTDQTGHAFFVKHGQPVQNPGLYFVPFDIPASIQTPAYLSLSLSARPSALCSVALWQLRLEEKRPGGLSRDDRKD